jgi:hypothetical protein
MDGLFQTITLSKTQSNVVAQSQSNAKLNTSFTGQTGGFAKATATVTILARLEINDNNCPDPRPLVTGVGQETVGMNSGLLYQKMLSLLFL